MACGNSQSVIGSQLMQYKRNARQDVRCTEFQNLLRNREIHVAYKKFLESDGELIHLRGLLPESAASIEDDEIKSLLLYSNLIDFSFEIAFDDISNSSFQNPFEMPEINKTMNRDNECLSRRQFRVE